MMRAFFLAIGITLCILGAECLLIHKAVLAPSPSSVAAQKNAFGNMAAMATAPAREIVPPDWAPWSLLTAGAVVFIYCFTIPRRLAGG